MRGALLPFVAIAALGCGDGGSPAAPTFQAAALPDATVMNEAGPPTDSGSDVTYAVCYATPDASFEDLRVNMFDTPSCGAASPSGCHSTSGSKSARNLLDFSLEAGAVYAELVGDGGGHPAVNLVGDAGEILRVAPSDAGASLLYIKLSLKKLGDPHYGNGMPLTTPGSVCPEALDAVRAWIDQGARRN